MAVSKFQDDAGRLMLGALAEVFAFAPDITADEDNRNEARGIFTPVSEVVEGGTEERDIAATRSDFTRHGLQLLTQETLATGNAVWRGAEVYQVMAIHTDSTGLRRYAIVPPGKMDVAVIDPE